MTGRVIQGFFVGGAMRSPAAAQSTGGAAPPRRAGPPPPAFAGDAAQVQPRMAPARPPLAHRTGAPPHGAVGTFEIDPVQVGLARGGGTPLPRTVLAKMEAAFGADFSAVRVHVGPQASRIGAVAFTTGNDLYFAPGQFQPDSAKGQQLIGHELAHVVQQRQGRVRATGNGVSVVQDRVLEAEADRLGMRAAAHRAPIQRKAMPGAGSRSAPRPGPIPGPPPRAFAGNRSIQRMVDDDYDPETDPESEAGSDIEEEVLIANAVHLADWRNGVDAGYDEGWDDAIGEEAAQANPVVSHATARGFVGLPNAVTVTGLQNHPPVQFIIDTADTAWDAGHMFGYGHGHTDGGNEAYRVCGWRRGNYPAIPALRANAALAQNGGNCVYCNNAASAQVDHVYPIQKHWVTLGYLGAPLAQINDANNLVGSCGPCNGAKSNTYLNAWGGHQWLVGQWFPWGPGTIPARRGTVIGVGNW